MDVSLQSMQTNCCADVDTGHWASRVCLTKPHHFLRVTSCFKDAMQSHMHLTRPACDQVQAMT